MNIKAAIALVKPSNSTEHPIENPAQNTPGQVHPAADLFPMMTEEELQEMASDIAENGLIHPIIVYDQNQIIDGRNRLAACKLAGVEPRFEKLKDRDARAFIVSANLARRYLTKGQQAMALAMIYPEAEKGGRGKNTEARKAVVSTGFSMDRLARARQVLRLSRDRLARARQVLRLSRDLAESVIRGSVSLDDALKEVDKARQRNNSADAKLQRLHKSAPDLGARVVEENITLDEGMAILYQREDDRRRIKEAGRDAEKHIMTFATNVTLIVSAINEGEEISIPGDDLKTLSEALRLLEKTMKKGKI